MADVLQLQGPDASWGAAPLAVRECVWGALTSWPAPPLPTRSPRAADRPWRRAAAHAAALPADARAAAWAYLDDLREGRAAPPAGVDPQHRDLFAAAFHQVLERTTPA